MMGTTMSETGNREDAFMEGMQGHTDDLLFSLSRLRITDVADLNLSGKAKEGAEALKKKYSEVVFTSGRRDVGKQAEVMADNIVDTNDRQWISKTYSDSTERRQLQKWVDDHPAAVTVSAIKTGLTGIMTAWTDAQRVKISKHLAGMAFDLVPIRGEKEKEIKDFINALPGVDKFLDGENGVDVWHVQFK